MKKLFNTAFFYAILAMIGGVFYREYTRIFGFTGRTSLSFVHLHLFIMGCVIFLILILFEKQFNLTGQKSFNKFYYTYNFGLLFMATMFVVRGIMQVSNINGGAMISGISGVSHIIFGIGIIFLFLLLKKAIFPKDTQIKS